jgi:1-acyl-sn-glycerol-3-phosphate acyltransferase
MNKILRFLFYRCFVRFVVFVALGLNIRHKERIPKQGSAIIVSNHNSHLDTMILMSLLPASLLEKAHPVAAWEYFLRNPVLAWFALQIVGILPLKRERTAKEENPFASCVEALTDGKILLFYPEGSRGEPEQLAQLKNGMTRLLKECPDVPVIPVFLHGAGKALPKGEALLVPFFCDVFIGNPLRWDGDRRRFMSELEKEINSLAAEGNFAPWQ